nr:hypothetical protein [uncultured Oscillibacter sp.]
MWNVFRNNRRPDLDAILNIPAAGREKHPNEEGYYTVRCPYCLEEFEPWEMEFRALVDTNGVRTAVMEEQRSRRDQMRDDETMPFGRSQEKREQAPAVERPQKKDTAEVQSNYFPVETDKKLSRFRELVHKPGGSVLLGKVLSLQNDNGDISKVKFHNMDRRMPFSEAKRYLQTHKVPVECVWDKFGHMTENCICPKCHNEMADKAGILPSYVIAFFGNTSCGKTVYKIRLLHAVVAEGAVLPGRAVMVGTYNTGETIDGQNTQDLLALYDMTFGEATRKSGRPIVEATDVKYIEPITLTLSRGGKETALVTFFDFPGEAIWGDQQYDWFVNRMREVLLDIDGIIFLLDPSPTSALQRHLPREYFPQTQDDEADVQALYRRNAQPTAVLQAFTKNYLRGGGILDVPMSIVYSKADLFRELIDRFRNGEISDGEVERMVSGLMENPRFLTEWVESGGTDRIQRDHTSVDMGNILEAERELKRFVMDSVLEQMLSYQFKRSVLFATSAVGAPVEFDGNRTNVPQAAGIRVTEPLEYLLWMFGLVEHAPMNEAEKLQAARLKNDAQVNGN